MRSLSTLLGMVLPVLIVAQEWELFPLDQRSYFPRTSWSNEEVVDMLLVDSVTVNGNEETLLFRSQLQLGGAENCTEDILASWSPPYYPNPFALNTLQQRDDTVFYSAAGSVTPFYFLPKVEVGQSWTVVSTYAANTYQEITITCASVVEESFWGVTDSVKTYTMTANGSSPGQVPVSNFTMRLSRSYGLLEFVPFGLFLFHPPSVDFSSTRCLGIDRNGTKLGFKLPGLFDHFDLAPGDLRLWRQQFNPFMQPGITNYLLDSITAVNITMDTIRITYLQWTEQLGIGISGPVQREETYSVQGSGAILGCPAGWVAIGHDDIWDTIDRPGLWIKEVISLAVEAFTGDTVITTRLYSAAYSVDTVTCWLNAPTDLGMTRTLVTGIGVSERCISFSSQPDPDCTTLIGSRIAGVVNGPIALGVHGISSPANMELATYPNPASTTLFIQGLAPNIPYGYEILNALGSSIAVGVIHDGSVSVEALAPGTYVLRCHAKDRTYVARFVKD